MFMLRSLDRYDLIRIGPDSNQITGLNIFGVRK